MKLSFLLVILAAILQTTLTFSPASVARLPIPAACASRCLAPRAHHCLAPRARRCPAPRAQQQPQQEFEVTARLSDERVEQLFAWLNRAFAGDARYNNLMLAFAGVFREKADEDSAFGNALADITNRPGVGDALSKLVEEALAEMPAEDEAVGQPFPLRQREQGCLGAMGAGQWTGQYRTRPHALLDVRGFASVDEWAASLPRGSRRTLVKANAEDFSVASRPIYGGEPAPHSTLAHFRCVVEHEVRLLVDSPDDFFDALQQGIGRYQNCVSQGGEIREYRDAAGRVLAFSQEATKGRVMRGQWFYATDAAAKRFVWFHSVQELVRRAIADEGVDYADLGPSGTDAFSELKHKYGFKSVADWHKVADYRGPFRYSFGKGESWAALDPPDYLFETSAFERMRAIDRRNF
mmetsp:Transcript_22390/g.51649  ORF Transcript_22390/g.51649 Transcript_22390/m.51649 type:complete len:408 (+) Transcript_22390:54-1277(+)